MIFLILFNYLQKEFLSSIFFLFSFFVFSLKMQFLLYILFNKIIKFLKIEFKNCKKKYMFLTNI